MATTITNESDIDALRGKKVLAYPLYLGGMPADASGVDNQFMIIKINTSTKSTPLKSDEANGPVVSSTATGTGTTGPSAGNVVYVPADTRAQFGDEAVSKENWVQKTGMTRLDKAIVLPMPNDYIVNTSINYDANYDPGSLTKLADMASNASMGMFAGIAATAAASGAASLLESKNKSPGFINNIKRAIVGGSSNTTSTDQLLASEKLAINPKKEVMFKDFGFRKFSFQYTFAPKSKVESETVLAIIETLRYYSLPEVWAGRQFYIFPAEFEVSFMLGNKLNLNIPRMATSVLERVGVNYSPGGNIWSTLPNGAPVAINMTLEFLELELIDRTRIWDKSSTIRSGY